MENIKIYAERDAMEMDKAGNHYCRHISAMTAEGLHSKSDIAAELGWRDLQIAQLQEQVRALAAENSKLRDWLISDTMCEVDETAFPSTVAVICEIQAQAVEGFGIFHNFSHRRFIQTEAKKYAARIRAGEQP